MDEDKLSVTAANGVPFTIRIVREGDLYGRNWTIKHDEREPLIEFYDARYDDDRFTHGYGQFVSRYTVSKIVDDRRKGLGLDLDGGVKSWKIDGATMARVCEWAKGRLRDEPKPTGPTI